LDFEIPFEMPTGKAQVSVTSMIKTQKTNIPLLSLRGSCKGLDTMEAYFERKRSEKAIEDRKSLQKTEDN
jgi:hypothetical protein